VHTPEDFQQMFKEGADSSFFGPSHAWPAPKVQPCDASAPGMELASNATLVGI
jgi:hypothetical protein